MTTPATLEFRGLRRSYGPTVALDGLDLTLNPGELLALLGPSGCGKTTALRMVAGFDKPDSGEVLLDGRDIVRTPANQRDVGMVFQSYSLFPHLTAADNVAFGMRMQRVSKPARLARARDLLSLVGLAPQADRYPHQMSGGQQQRVALARALALEPRVLLLDEPLSALDAKVRQSLRGEIRRLQLELGITTLFVTHDQEEALSLADRVAVMNAGRLEQCATPDELYNAPATPFVAGFIGEMNRLEGQLNADSTRVAVLGAEREVVSLGAAAIGGHGQRVDVLIRPEDLVVTADPSGAARVLSASFRGGATRLTVGLGNGQVALADLPSVTAHTLPPGTAVRIGAPPRPVLIDRPVGVGAGITA